MEENKKRKQAITIQDSETEQRKQDSEDKKQKQAVIQPSTPSKSEGPARVPLPPPPPPTTTHVAGIFSSAPSVAPSFLLLRPYPDGIDLPSPSFFGIPAPFTVVSSSSGLLLIRSSSAYHVANPFLHSPAGRRQLPPTPRPHSPATPAVLSVDSRDESDPVFRVVCAIEEPHRGGHGYTFDTFSSKDDEWFSTLIDESPLFGARRIIGRTGVSNGCGMAFWLTDVPPAVVRVTSQEEGDYAEVFSVPEDARDPAATLQLGRLSESCIGLIAATQAYVVLHKLELDKSWSLRGFLNVARSEKEAGELPGVLSVVCRWPQERPEVTRFEGDVTMRINGRMVVWEIGWGNQSMAIRRLPAMPEWDLIDGGVPYVYTKMAAWDFLEAEMQVMREFDQKRSKAVIQDSSRDAKKQEPVVARLASKGKNIVIHHPPPKIKRPALVPLPPSTSATYTYDVDSFSYDPGLSTAGFFTSSAGTSPTFRFLRPYPNLNLPVPSFFDIPSPFSVLSSSAGLLLVRSASAYHVLNPFIHSPASHRPIPQPDTPHASTTPAILAAVDTRNGGSAYYVICAIEEKMDERDRRYTFDIYSSNTGEWLSTLLEDAVLLGTRQIIPSTGVSNARGNAFWLTDAPQALVKVTVGGHAYGELIPIPFGTLRPWARLQLGRLSGSCIGIIATTWTEVTLLRLELDNSFVRHGFLNVKSYENEAVNVPSALSVVSQEWPEAVRFEREVAMWIHGRMVVWEIDWEHRSTRTERLHMMPWWTRRPESIGDGVPYVETKRTAGGFTAALDGV